MLATRIGAVDAASVLTEVPGGRYEPDARLLSWRRAPARGFTMAVVTAGTADVPVAAEAAAVARAICLGVTTVFDVGVAGLHRLLSVVDTLRAADCVVVVAWRRRWRASSVDWWRRR